MVSADWGMSEMDDIRDEDAGFWGDDAPPNSDRKLDHSKHHRPQRDRHSHHSSSRSHRSHRSHGRSYSHTHAYRHSTIAHGALASHALDDYRLYRGCRNWDKTDILLAIGISAVVLAIFLMAFGIRVSNVPATIGGVIFGAIGLPMSIYASIQKCRNSNSSMAMTTTATTPVTSIVPQPTVEQQPVNVTPPSPPTPSLTAEEAIIVNHVRATPSTVRDLQQLPVLTGKRKGEIGGICDSLVQKNILKKAGANRKEIYSLATATVIGFPLASSQPSLTEDIVSVARAQRNEGTLAKRRDYLYLELDADYITAIFQRVQQQHPAVKRPGTLGAHISIIRHDEWTKGTVSQITTLGQKHLFNPVRFEEITKGRKRLYVLVVDPAPELKQLRAQFCQTSTPHGHDFHITIAEASL